MLDTFNNLTNLQKSLLVTILSIVLFIIFTGVSYSAFSHTSALINSQPSNTLTSNSPSVSDANSPMVDQGPKTESCPLNGSLHTTQARQIWEAKRPLAVMIENSLDARPQSGLSMADVVYEAVAEGGITRFMAVFLCNPQDTEVGPVRSARTYFLDWLSEYNALYAHVGGANTPGPADALGQIVTYSILDLNQFSIGFPVYWRDYERLGHPVATEHTMYSSTQKLWQVGQDRGWTVNYPAGQTWSGSFIPWKFKSDAPAASNPPTQGQTLADKVDINFWQGYSDYSVSWQYDPSCDCYKRSNGGVAQIDMDSKQPLIAKNIVVQFETETHANDGYTNNEHMLYKTIGQGKAIVFQDGKASTGTWNKSSRTSRSEYNDASGNQISFDRGPIWIETVPEGAQVNF